MNIGLLIIKNKYIDIYIDILHSVYFQNVLSMFLK